METGRFDADRVRRSAEESLEALGIDRFQILHLHDPEHASDLNEITRTGGALDALFRLKGEGLVHAAGIAMGRTDILLALLKDWPFDIVLSHNRYTLLNRSAAPIFDYATARGISIFNAAPFAGGVLAKSSATFRWVTYQQADDAALEPVRAVEEVCQNFGAAPGAIALKFSMRDGRIASTIVGVSRPERARETLEWARASIDNSIWRELNGLAFDTQDPEADRAYVPG